MTKDKVMVIPCCPFCKKIYFLDFDGLANPPQCEHLLAWRTTEADMWELAEVTDPAIFIDGSDLLPPISGGELDSDDPTDALLLAAYDGVYDLAGSVEKLLTLVISPDTLRANETVTTIDSMPDPEDMNVDGWRKILAGGHLSDTEEFFTSNAQAVRDSLRAALERARELSS